MLSTPLSSGLIESMISLTAVRISSRWVEFNVVCVRSSQPNVPYVLFVPHTIALSHRKSTRYLSGSLTNLCGVFPHATSPLPSSW